MCPVTQKVRGLTIWGGNIEDQKVGLRTARIEWVRGKTEVYLLCMYVVLWSCVVRTLLSPRTSITSNYTTFCSLYIDTGYLKKEPK